MNFLLTMIHSNLLLTVYKSKMKKAKSGALPLTSPALLSKQSGSSSVSAFTFRSGNSPVSVRQSAKQAAVFPLDIAIQEVDEDE